MPVRLEWVAKWTSDVLMMHGVGADAAATVARSLRYAELRGTETHGFSRVPVYLARLRGGGILGDVAPKVVSRGGACAVVDCSDGLGAVGAQFAAVLAGELVEDEGVAVVTGRNANHFGALGFYIEPLARRGYIAVLLCNTDAMMAPPTGGRGVLGTNPISIAIPTTAGAPALLDMATTAVSLGKVLVAARDGEEIPLGWAVNEHGQPTVDATAALAGALLPAAGVKGFGLAFMVDALSALGGSEVSPDVRPLYGDTSHPQRLGFTMIVLDPERFVGASAYMRKVERLIRAVRNSGREGDSPPMIPGEPEQRFVETAKADELPSVETLAQLMHAATEFELPFPDELASQVRGLEETSLRADGTSIRAGDNVPARRAQGAA